MLKTRGLSRTSDTSTLPDGWTISPRCKLKTQLQLPLDDRVTNSRTSNGDSFQAEEGGLDVTSLEEWLKTNHGLFDAKPSIAQRATGALLRGKYGKYAKP